jgi:hypothetical protein
VGEKFLILREISENRLNLKKPEVNLGLKSSERVALWGRKNNFPEGCNIPHPLLPWLNPDWLIPGGNPIKAQAYRLVKYWLKSAAARHLNAS